LATALGVVWQRIETCPLGAMISCQRMVETILADVSWLLLCETVTWVLLCGDVSLVVDEHSAATLGPAPIMQLWPVFAKLHSTSWPPGGSGALLGKMPWQVAE
jgi:hypothetical protein